MMPSFANIRVETVIDGQRAAVFDHWLDPAARQRWEAPAESGMRYLNFAPEPGGVEHVEVSHEGAVIGEMTQRIIAVQAPELLVSQVTGTFGGATTMVMQVAMTFEETETGTRIIGNSQVIDITGRDVQAEHEGGWKHLFTSFAADFAAEVGQHG